MVEKGSPSSHISSASLRDYIPSLKFELPFLKKFLETESPSSNISFASLRDHISSHNLDLPFLKILLKMESPSSHISKSLSLLEEQEKEYESLLDISHLKDHILSLKFGLPFLEIFLSISNNEELKLRIRRVLFDVRLELHSLSNRPPDGSLILYLDSAYTNLREQMKNVIIKPDTRKYDVIFLKLYSGDGDLRKTNDFLLEKFGDLSRCKADLIGPFIKEIKDIKEKLMRLQALLTYVADAGVHITKENKKLLTPLVTLLDKAACLFFSCLVDKMDKEMALAMKHRLSHLLDKINVKEIYVAVLRASKLFESTDYSLESEFYLLENLIKLLHCHADSVIYLTDPSEKLIEKLKFLKSVLEHLPHDVMVEKFNYLVTSIEEITCTAIPIIYSCYDEDMKEDMTRELNDARSHLHDQINHIQAEVKEINLYQYPKTDGLGFLDIFLRHLDELLKFRPELIDILKNQTETLYEEFYFLRSFLEKIKEQHNEHEELEDLWTRIIGLAYQAEYVIDFYLVKSTPDTRILLSLSKIIEKSELIKSDVTRIYNKKKYHIAEAHNVAKTSNHVQSQATDTVVGFKDEKNQIMEYLVGYPKKRHIVSIVGMPGLGKTTLAKKIYEDSSIVQRFDVRAWCSVSQTYQKRELLLNILGDVIEVTEEIKTLNYVELGDKLYKSLKGRRYFIVIDDLWDIEAWQVLVRSLPDDNNHSRILMTSRLQDVASKTKASSIVHTLRQLSDDESWELFQKKLFQKERFPQELLQVGKKIAQSCYGLPLAIVVIAGFHAKEEKNVHKWKQIAERLSSHILNDSQSQCKAITELSYNHLPEHLKSCFLYFAAFPGDEEIPVRKLKWLWIAEGFVLNDEKKRLEDVAEEYFKDLISRSLVTETKEKSHGGIKACRVHDLLHNFCLEKAKEESFLQVIHVNRSSEFSRAYDRRRLSIYSEAIDLGKAKPSGCSVRSLIHTSTVKISYFRSIISTIKNDISFIFQNFKLLRVLDLASTDIGMNFSGIELLIHLRYLAVKARITSIPSSIANLWNLQFFLIEVNSNVVDVPDSLWDMVNLRHVHINRRASFGMHRTRLENSSLENLETLSAPCLSYGEDAENLLRRLPKLRKLRCVFLDYLDDSTKCYQFPVLDFLGQLVSLQVFFKGLQYPGKRCKFYFPSNLKKLTLFDFRLLWDDISTIGRTLPNLEVLKLIGEDYDCRWSVNDGDFPNLKYLKLSRLYRFCEWVASEESFPKLEQLLLDNCWDLREIPPCFGGINTLRMITVRDCQVSVDDSARSIGKRQQDDCVNEEFKVNIYPWKRD